MKRWQGEEKKIKVSQTRFKNAAGKSELSVSDSSGAVAIYNAVTQPGVWQKENEALTPCFDVSAFLEGLGAAGTSDSLGQLPVPHPSSSRPRGLSVLAPWHHL